jgi:methionine-rich copper-binding protein CopC
MKRWIRGGVVMLVSAAALVLGTAPAWAHSRLESSDPASGSSIASGPRQVSLTFNEPLQPGFTVITVIGPDGNDYHSGDPAEVDDTVSVSVLPLGPAGTYKIGYRVVSADGHPVSGNIPFTLTTAGPGSPKAAPPIGSAAQPPSGEAAASSDGGAPVWPWIVGAVVVVGLGVGAALRMGRS